MKAFDFAVSGGGVAGLSAALALERLGATVAVFERRPGVDNLGAGLQLSPNATRVACSLGLLGRLEACATEPRALRIRRGRDGGAIATMPLGETVRRRYGAPVLVLHRADLLRELAAALAGLDRVAVSHGTTLESFDPAAGHGRATGPSGSEPVTVGGLIHAEGLHGGSGSGRYAVYSGKSAWRALVPAEALPSPFRVPETNLWLGADAHVVHYPIRGGSLVNIVVITDDAKATTDAVDPWAETGDPAVLRHRLRHWDGLVQRLVDIPAVWRKWPLFDGMPEGRWAAGRETRVGDAAHPMLPFLAQGASQAFEDAAALAAAVGRSCGDPVAAFADYERVRRPAVERVQAASRRQGRIYHSGAEVSAARDLAMRLLGPDRLLARMDWLYGPVSI